LVSASQGVWHLPPVHHAGQGCRESGRGVVQIDGILELVNSSSLTTGSNGIDGSAWYLFYIDVLHCTMNSHAKGIQLSLLCLLILGILPIIATQRTNAGNAITFSFWLSFWQLAFATPVYLFQRKKAQQAEAPEKNLRRFSKIQTWALIVLTGILFSAATFAYVLGVDQIGPVTFAVAIQAYPFFALLWEALFLHRRKSIWEMTFILVIAISMVYLGTQGTWQLSSVARGFWIALIVPLLWSIAHVIIKETMNASSITPSEVILTRVLLAALLLGIACIFNQGFGGFLTSGMTFKFQMIAVLMGFAYYLELLSWFSAVKYIDVSIGASITAPAPAITVLLAVVLLKQELHGYQTVALIFVLGSVIGLIRYGRKEKGAG
jgi:drug/metabolite transporter (DMT)-like permease